MKRKVLSILICLVASSLLIVSCGGGLCAVPLDVKVYIQKQDGSVFTKTELNSFKYTSSSNGSITGGTVDGKVQPAQEETDGAVYVLFQYHVGSSRYEGKIKKIVESFDEKLPEFSFSIEDPNNVYQTYEMNPLSDNYEVVDKEMPCIKYSIKLKKKGE